jgi:hypothetical protein
MELVSISECLGVDLSVIEVAASLWAVFDTSVGSSVALGHIDQNGTRFFVGLEGDELEPYSFESLDQSVGWFEELCFAVHLGSPIAPAPIRKTGMPTENRAARASQIEAETE